MTYPTPGAPFPLPTNDDFNPSDTAWLFEMPTSQDGIVIYLVGANELTTKRRAIENTPTVRKWATGPPIGANTLQDFNADKYYQTAYNKKSWTWFLAQLAGLIATGISNEIPEAEAFYASYGYLFEGILDVPHGTTSEMAAIHNVLVQTQADAMTGGPPKLWSRSWHEDALETFRRGWQYTNETTVTRSRTYWNNFDGWFTVRSMLGAPNYTRTFGQGIWDPAIQVEPGMIFGPFDLGSSGSISCPNIVHSASAFVEYHIDYNLPLYHLTLTSPTGTQTRITTGGGGLSKVLVCGLHSHSAGQVGSNFRGSIAYEEARNTVKNGHFV